jgi:type III secretion protein L
MAGYYRLKELGFTLAAGAHVLPRAEVEPIEAATALLDAAKRQAEDIVGEAKQAFEDEKRRGYEEGLTAGRLEAARMLLAETELLDGKLAGIETELAALVVASVRRLVQGFSDREKAEILVREALRQMRREKKAELRVAPEQYAEIRDSIEAIRKDFPEVQLIDVVEDASLKPPQIVVETSIGRVEGDLGRHLDELERAIAEAVHLSAPEAEAAE